MDYALLLSGGNGTRTGSDIPKQYVKPEDSPMMVTFALRTLLMCSRIDAVYVVAESKWRSLILADCNRSGFSTDKIKGFADPGINRQASILNGMEEIINRVSGAAGKGIGHDDTILVHDAARPYLKELLIHSCYDALCGHDGVMPVIPVKDTVYMSGDGRSVSGLLDRQRIFAGQSPELFVFKPYHQANIALLPDRIQRINGASEPAVMAGLDLIMIPGDEDNVKVTTAADMEKFMAAATEHKGE